MSAIDHNPGNTYAHREVPVDALRRAFLKSDVTVSELARRLGWMRPDSKRVSRQLGLIIDSDGKTSRTRIRETMSYNRALEILDALGIDPVDVDL